MYVRIIKSYREIVAICDAELIGKRFEEGKFQLDIKENFYRGEKNSEREAIDIIQNMSEEDAIFNIVGEKSVNAALKSGVISKQGIKRIQGIPFALVLL